MKKTFHKVAIIGVGLIGGSIALALKKKHLVKSIIGVSAHEKSIKLSKRIGIIDVGSTKLEVIKDADLVILSTPVDTILKLAPKIAGIIKPGCIVFDVGSTKAEIVAELEIIFSNYIGTHPLAGSEKHGSAYSSPELFMNSLCILTPTKKTKMEVYSLINRLWKDLGSRTVAISPKKHDQILSFVSHLPHLVAFSLIDAIPKDFLRFASSGLKDTTRIAASDVFLWKDIILANRNNLLGSIEIFERKLSKIKSLIKGNNKLGLTNALKGAKIKREYLK